MTLTLFKEQTIYTFHCNLQFGWLVGV